jgi:hypothetical protein
MLQAVSIALLLLLLTLAFLLLPLPLLLLSPLLFFLSGRLLRLPAFSVKAVVIACLGLI